MMSKELSQPQLEALDGIQKALSEGHRKLLVTMPTQTGKTGAYLWLINAFYKAAALDSALVQTPMTHLADQILDEVEDFAPDIFSANSFGKLDLKHGLNSTALNVAAYAGGTKSLLSGIIDPSKLGVIVLDEGHQSLSELRQAALQNIPNALQLAVTASPSYSKAKNLLKAGFVEAYHLTLKNSVERGFSPSVRNILVEPRDFAGSLDDVSIVNGDFDIKDLDNLLLQESLIASAIDFMKYWRSPKTNRPIAHGTGIVFCSSINHARAIAKRFNGNISATDCGRRIPAVAIWGDMPNDQKKDIIEKYKRGEIMSLVCADYLIHGFSNRPTDFILNLCPSRSAVVVEQRAGRAMANHDGKDEALIVDFLYPAHRNFQLLYGDVVGGFLFEKSYSNANNKEYETRLFDLPELNGMRFFYDEKEIFSFVSERERQKKLNSAPHMTNFSVEIRNAMLDRDLKSLGGLWKRMQLVVRLQDASDYIAGHVTEQSAKDLIYGFESPFDGEFAEYTPTATIMAAALKLHARQIFGPPPQERLRGKFTRSYDAPEHAYAVDFDWSPLYQKLADEANFAFMDDPDIIRGLETEMVVKSKKKGETTEISTVFSPDARRSVDPFSYANKQELKKFVSILFNSLTPREERVLRMRFGIGVPEATMDQVGCDLHVSRERIRQIEAKALRKLKHPARSQRLRSFLDNSDRPKGKNNWQSPWQELANYEEGLKTQSWISSRQEERLEELRKRVRSLEEKSRKEAERLQVLDEEKIKRSLLFFDSISQRVNSVEAEEKTQNPPRRLILSENTNAVCLDGHEIKLSEQNFLIVSLLMHNEGESFAADQIADYVMEQKSHDWPTTSESVKSAYYSLRRVLGGTGEFLVKSGKDTYSFQEPARNLKPVQARPTLTHSERHLF